MVKVIVHHLVYRFTVVGQLPTVITHVGIQEQLLLRLVTDIMSSNCYELKFFRVKNSYFYGGMNF